jgi:hypothetical protein
MLPDYDIWLPKHVRAIMWNKKEYKIQCMWLVILYMFNNACYEILKKVECFTEYLWLSKDCVTSVLSVVSLHLVSHLWMSLLSSHGRGLVAINSCRGKSSIHINGLSLSMTINACTFIVSEYYFVYIRLVSNLRIYLMTSTKYSLMECLASCQLFI